MFVLLNLKSNEMDNFVFHIFSTSWQPSLEKARCDVTDVVGCWWTCCDLSWFQWMLLVSFDSSIDGRIKELKKHPEGWFDIWMIKCFWTKRVNEVIMLFLWVSAALLLVTCRRDRQAFWPWSLYYVWVSPVSHPSWTPVSFYSQAPHLFCLVYSGRLFKPFVLLMLCDSAWICWGGRFGPFPCKWILNFTEFQS